MNPSTTPPSEPHSAVIRTEALTKHYHHPLFTWKIKARALTDLSIDIERGEVFGLLGPNGSGKSTTIKLILGLVFPTSGRVSVFGRAPGDVSVKARIGYLPEESYLYRYLTAEETLDFYGRLFRLDRRERRRRTGELLESVGLARDKHRPVAEFSKGMQRRVALAQCLINNPDLIILDEPTSGMDPVGTAEIKDLILRLKGEGKTVLLSSHLLANVEDVCDRASILCDGRERLSGRIDALIADESLTQVTAPMDAATVEAVEALIRERHGADTPIDVSPPVEGLEKLFLRVVAGVDGEQPSRPRGADAALEPEEPAAERGAETTGEAARPTNAPDARRHAPPGGSS